MLSQFLAWGGERGGVSIYTYIYVMPARIAGGVPPAEKTQMILPHLR